MRITPNVPGLAVPRHGLALGKSLTTGIGEPQQVGPGIAVTDNSKAKVADSDDDQTTGKRSPTNTSRPSKHEVDRRVSDGGTMRVTVIAYSDGSRDTLKEIKGGPFNKAAGIPKLDRPQTDTNASRNVVFGGKGMMIDKSA